MTSQIKHVMWDWNGTLSGDGRALIESKIDVFASAWPCNAREISVAPYPAHLRVLRETRGPSSDGRRAKNAGPPVPSRLQESARAYRPLSTGARGAGTVVPGRGRRSLLSMHPHEQLAHLVHRNDISHFFTLIEGASGDLGDKSPHLTRLRTNPAEATPRAGWPTFSNGAAGRFRSRRIGLCGAILYWAAVFSDSSSKSSCAFPRIVGALGLGQLRGEFLILPPQPHGLFPGRALGVFTHRRFGLRRPHCSVIAGSPPVQDVGGVTPAHRSATVKVTIVGSPVSPCSQLRRLSPPDVSPKPAQKGRCGTRRIRLPRSRAEPSSSLVSSSPRSR